MEDDSISKFFPEEWFEESKYDFENVGLVHDVDVFNSYGYTILKNKGK